MKIKRRTAYIWILFPALLIFSACKKDNDKPQWDVDVLVPLVKSTLDISDLINDTLLQSDSNHVLHFVYEKNLYDLDIDSLVDIPDTTVKTVVSYPVSITIPAGFPIYGTPQEIALGISGPQIRFAILRHGMLLLKAVNYTPTRIQYFLDIPGAILNTDTFSATGYVNSAPAGDSLVYEISFDLSGYRIDMTGTSGTDFNTISYQLLMYTDSFGGSVTTSAGMPVINFYETFSDAFPEYVKGYLGQDTIREGPTTTQVDVFRKIQGGLLNLADAKLTCTLVNGIGADGRLILSNFTGTNSRTGGSVTMTAFQSTNHLININRALETGPPISPVNTTINILSRTSTNSNIVDFIENLPDAITYSVKLFVNPIGNQSLGNDFVYANYLVDAKMRLEMPLSFSAGGLTFIDTINFISKPEETFENFRSGILKLIAENGFPFQLMLSLTLLDETSSAITTLTSTGILASAIVGSTGRVSERVESVVDFPVSETQMSALKKTKKIILRAAFTTTQYPVLRNIYDDYSIGLTLVADFSYMNR